MNENKKPREFWLVPENDEAWIKNFNPIEKYDQRDFTHDFVWFHVREVIDGQDEKDAGIVGLQEDLEFWKKKAYRHSDLRQELEKELNSSNEINRVLALENARLNAQIAEKNECILTLKKTIEREAGFSSQLQDTLSRLSARLLIKDEKIRMLEEELNAIKNSSTA